jgi:hypothetical protein
LDFAPKIELCDRTVFCPYGMRRMGLHIGLIRS